MLSFLLGITHAFLTHPLPSPSSLAPPPSSSTLFPFVPIPHPGLWEFKGGGTFKDGLRGGRGVFSDLGEQLRVSMAKESKYLKAELVHPISNPGNQGHQQPHIHRTHRQLLDTRVHREQLLDSSSTRIAPGPGAWSNARPHLRPLRFCPSEPPTLTTVE